jgi:hypothetical protein
MSNEITITEPPVVEIVDDEQPSAPDSFWALLGLAVGAAATGAVSEVLGDQYRQMRNER